MTQDPESCLTISQIEVLHKTFSDYYDANQTYISGGFYPGSEINLPQSVLGAQPEFGSDFFRFFVLKLSIVTPIPIYCCEPPSL